jgi:predicted anti-sigma-YlaC factor YlaD
MNHQHATRLLSDFAERTLEPELSAQVEKHLDDCHECREWLEIYSLLHETPDCARRVPGELLANYAVDENWLDQAGRDMVRAHLGVCENCRDEIELVRTALAAARQQCSADKTHKQMSVISIVPPRKVAVAAALVIAVLAVATVTIFRGIPWVRPEQRVQNLTITGDRVLEGDGEVVIASTQVAAGANLTIHAGDIVVFGDGFSVQNGASLVVGTHRSDGALNVGYR